MKKLIIGTIFGFILATAAGANAQEVKNVIGEVIDGAFSVKVNGVELSDQAIVVQGTSYLPVRAFGDAAGYDIKFNPELGIELTKKSDIPTTPIETPVVTPQPTTPEKTVADRINELRKEIESQTSRIESIKLFIEKNEEIMKEPGVNKESFQKVIDGYNASIKESETKIADYEAQIAALQSK